MTNAANHDHEHLTADQAQALAITSMERKVNGRFTRPIIVCEECRGEVCNALGQLEAKDVERGDDNSMEFDDKKEAVERDINDQVNRYLEGKQIAQERQLDLSSPESIEAEGKKCHTTYKKTSEMIRESADELGVRFKEIISGEVDAPDEVQDCLKLRGEIESVLIYIHAMEGFPRKVIGDEAHVA